jgi:arylsulfatase A-like enzyme
MKGKVRDFGEDEFRTIRALHWGMISEMDAQLGRIWAAVKAAGAWDDTIVILTSDHAEMMGDHSLLGKGGYFDQSYHIPLIVRDPARRKAAGTEVDRFTEAVDIMPTLLELLGATPQSHLDGRSLASFLDGKTPATWRDAAHWEFDFRSIENGSAEKHFGLKPQQCNLAVFRMERFKYVHFGGGMPPLLYDLEADPGELDNLAGDPAFLPVRLELAERLLAWRAEHLDQSLALSALTEDGVAGAPAALARI